ncbi:MAG: hypothetical protein RLZZ245_2934, partial [Verrucomicrobiota bacterium]
GRTEAGIRPYRVGVEEGESHLWAVGDVGGCEVLVLRLANVRRTGESWACRRSRND